MNETLLNTDFEESRAIYMEFISVPREKNTLSNKLWNVLYIYEGHGEIHINNTCTPINTGDCFIIKPNTEYSVTSPENKNDILARLCTFVFTPDYFEALKPSYIDIFKADPHVMCDILLSKNSACLCISDDDAQNIHNILWLAAHEYNHFKIGSETIMKSSMLNFLICATRLYECQINGIPPTITTNKSLEELKKYIRSNFAYNLTLDFLASQVHLSREHLSRSFKKYTGKTISAFLLEVRITRAKQMLERKKNSITDISSYCGYTTLGNFQRAFKKFTGMSPSEYRKKYKDINQGDTKPLDLS